MGFSMDKLRRLFSFSLFTLLCVTLTAQDITLTFTGSDASGRYTQLDHMTVSIEPAIRLGYKFPCKRK